jgi:prolyl oligopeptidase
MREHKQNAFDDFHAAAEWLISNGWTTPDRLGILGASNAGLLVGAALTQRPALYGAVVCAAPLLDMARYEQSGLGPSWRSEYGSASVPEELEWLLSYSPYHRIEDGVAYPATMFVVYETDTRVDPLHARKMCAALQHSNAAPTPILYNAIPGVGHGARAHSTGATIGADTLAFLAHHTGLVGATNPRA